MNKAKSVNEYFASMPQEARSALTKLRKTIRMAAPGATEVISYGIPTFKLDRMLVSYAAFRNHCSFFPLSAAVLKAHKSELKNYQTSKGTIRFQVDKPLPASLVKRIVRARIEENEQRARGK